MGSMVGRRGVRQRSQPDYAPPCLYRVNSALAARPKWSPELDGLCREVRYKHMAVFTTIA